MDKRGNGSRPKGLQRFFRFQYLRVLRIKATPHQIALGLAFGIFIGFMPIIPFQTPTVLLMAFMFRASKLAAFLATFISNPVNMPLFYSMLYMVGRKVFPFVEAPQFNPRSFELMAIAELGTGLLVIMILGGFVLGVPSAVAVYFVSRRLVAGYQKRRALRMLKKKTRGSRR